MLIEMDDVSVTLQDRVVLRDITLRISERRVGVIGANGSGKSTLARLLNGLVLPATGTVRMDGLDTHTAAREVRRRVGFVFQNPDNQIVFPVVSEDLGFGLRNIGVPRKDIPGRVQTMLEQLDIGHLAQRPSHGLSGGEKQMVALASVLIMQPELIAFDEPTTLLDLGNRNRFRRAIDALEQTAVVVTHDLELLEDFERVLVINDGRLVMDAPPREAVEWYRSQFA